MVRLIYKKSDQNQFMYATTLTATVDQVIKDLVTSTFSLIVVNNLRIRLDRLCVCMEELAQKGPLKPEELHGLSNYEEHKEYFLSYK